MLWRYLFRAGLVALGAAAIYAAAMFILPPKIEVIKPVRGPAVQAVYATGIVEASVMVPIAPRTASYLTTLMADEGEEVTKGQVLAQLEDTDLQNSIAQLRAQRDLAQTTFDRTQKLTDQGATTRKSRDEAEAALLAAQAELSRAEAEANYMKLVAPADGVIIKRDGEVGQLVTPTTPVFWMSCCAPLRISAEVDEEDIPLVKTGQVVKIQSDAFPGQVFDGKVSAVTPKGDPDARSYRVRVAFDQPEIPFLIGMTAETNIIVKSEESALLVPPTAVHGGQALVVRDGRAVITQVKVGAQGSGAVAIEEGIQDTDVVVTKFDAVNEGDSLRPSVVSFTPSSTPAATGKKSGPPPL